MRSNLKEFQLSIAMNNKYMPSEYKFEIFHYTSPKGFSSILFSNDINKVTLWASRYDCLNDKSEGILVKEVFKEVCEEMLHNKEITKERYTFFKNIEPARRTWLSYLKGDEIRSKRPECDRYICSLSKNKDSLSMWNYYSKGNKYEGFNIGFDPSSISDSLGRFFERLKATYHIYPVIYDRNEQKRLVKDFLLELNDLYLKDEEYSIRTTISNQLKDWSLVFKNDCFQHEEEVRIIVDVAQIETAISVKYRFASGYVVPYIELKLDKSSITAVNFGPLQFDEKQKQHQKKVMKDMLCASNYDARVNCSKIPIRY